MSKSQDRFGDERLTKSAGEAARSARDNADVNRVQQDGTALSSAERRRMLRETMVSQILPTPPEIPGWHQCWLSTTSSTDPIHKRLQVGYQPVRISEVPGFEQYKVDGGQFDGCVEFNEMLLFKIPNEIYQDLMRIYHHDIPLEQEQSIRDSVHGKNDRDSEGRELAIVEGEFNNLGRAPTRAPQFQ